jgi:GNAT superfamily N-acetyltransferase
VNSKPLDNGLVTLRAGKPTDRNYILATWTHGILPEAPHRWHCKQARDRHHVAMEQIVDNDCVVVACNSADEDHIIGYAISTPGVAIHWIYVKAKFRGKGLGALMACEAYPEIGASPVCYTHRNKVAEALERKWGLQYDPTLIRYSQ